LKLKGVSDHPIKKFVPSYEVKYLKVFLKCKVYHKLTAEL